ncbi:MAG: LLM class flavin-dependent oxidoreductase [Acidobacteria bacterium]|nr:MAG: LLM class flavin-dependent oxidoreductase [Acidobacteriota bacterium]
MSDPKLRIHWSMSSVGVRYKGARSRARQDGAVNLEAHVAFCRQAEARGIDSLLTAIGFHRPDPLVLAAALGRRTERVKFMVACRSGISSPTLFVQQVNTLSALCDGRVNLNVVAGHTPREQRYYGDFLDHDERYARTDEFLTICRALWRGDGPVDFDGRYYRIEQARLNTPFCGERRAPEIFLGGNSPQAIELAVKHADCLLTLPAAPGELAARIAPVLAAGKEVGLLVSLRARASREQALAACDAMLEAIDPGARRVHRDFARRSDSAAFTSTIARAGDDSQWLTPTLWSGAVPYLGAPAIALVGSYDEVAAAILDYHRAGISHFLFMGWPDVEEMSRFRLHVLPRVRALAAAERSAAQEALV